MPTRLSFDSIKQPKQSQLSTFIIFIHTYRQWTWLFRLITSRLLLACCFGQKREVENFQISNIFQTSLLPDSACKITCCTYDMSWTIFFFDVVHKSSRDLTLADCCRTTAREIETCSRSFILSIHQYPSRVKLRESGKKTLKLFVCRSSINSASTSISAALLADIFVFFFLLHFFVRPPRAMLLFGPKTKCMGASGGRKEWIFLCCVWLYEWKRMERSWKINVIRKKRTNCRIP